MKTQQSIHQIRKKHFRIPRLSFGGISIGFILMTIYCLILLQYDTTVSWILIISVNITFPIFGLKEMRHDYLEYIKTIKENDQYRIQYDWYELLKDGMVFFRSYWVGMCIFLLMCVCLYIFTHFADQRLQKLFDGDKLATIAHVQLSSMGIQWFLGYLYANSKAKRILK